MLISGFIFGKVGCLAIEGKRPQTCLQDRMAEEEIRARLAKVDGQMT